MNAAKLRKLSYYKQETAYTCGAACMRMTLETFGIRRSEAQLARMLSTNRVIGVAFQHMPALAERYRLDYAVRRNATIAGLRTLFSRGDIIIVCYFLEKEHVGHYAIVAALSSSTITLVDPHLGPNTKHRLSSFSRLWHSDPRSKDVYERHWCLSLRRASRPGRP